MEKSSGKRHLSIDKLNGLSTDLGFSVYTNGTKSMVDVCNYTSFNGWCRITARNCSFFTVKRVKDARKSAGYALVLIAILYTTAPAIAVLQN
jgi:cation/acetate symporter